MKAELRQLFTNKKLLIPVIAILFIPILYSGMYLWAFWNPYGHLEDLPVAIVNEDKGATFEGEQLKLGEELVDKLKENHEFDYKFIDNEEAYKGLEERKYYLLVEIPENFSENATTLLDEKPKKLELIYVANEGTNFLASQIGGNAMEKIKSSISEKVTETYAESVFSNIEELADGIEQVSEGAGKLTDGSIDLNNGTKELHESLEELASKSIEFNQGMNSANSGSTDLASGITTLNEGLTELGKGHSQLTAASKDIAEGNTELAKGISDAKAGFEQIDQKLPEMTSGTEQLAQGAENLSSSLNTWSTEAQKVSGGVNLLQQKLAGVMAGMDPAERQELQALLANLQIGTTQLSESAGVISNGAAGLAGNLNTLNEKQGELEQGVHQLTEGSAMLQAGSDKILAGEEQFQAGMKTFDQKLAEAQAGTSELAQGASSLQSGLNELTQGTEKITSGASQLEDGAGKLADGTNEVAAGSKELAEKLADGAKEATSVEADKKTYNMMANPVEIKDEKINHVPNYGTGFAPYFLSLSLFVGALMISIVFPFREPASVPRNGMSWFTSKFTILAGIGIVQGLIAAAILMGVLGLEVQNIPLFLLFVVVTSLTFVALIQFFVTPLGDPGRFVAILILILQLTTSAGTFPLELIPGFLQKIHAFLPMTYSVQGFKAVISSGDFGFMWHNLFILLGFMCVFIVGSLLYFRFKHKRQFYVLAKKGE